MGSISPAKLGKSALTIAIMVGILGVGFGESLYKKACYVNFLALESFPTLNPMHREHLITEIDYEDQSGLKHRLFVFETPVNDQVSSCRVVATDENYRVTSTWNADRNDKLLNVGFMQHTNPPVLELVRHTPDETALICEHFCLNMGVLQNYDYKSNKDAPVTR